MVNKIDQAEQAEVEAKLAYWREQLPNAAEVLAISALNALTSSPISRSGF